METPKDCPFCRSNNLLKGDVLAETADGFLTEAISDKGSFLIIPRMHAESPADLPDTWWQDVKQLLEHIPNLPEHYNISLNRGHHAGQSVKHLHFWVIPREGGQPASGKGLISLIRHANQDL